ncbi:hypothetical protein PM082_013322 [Marasmius tenuissimus]|nr:hypothetical protein PM082_013322 [Marasmius tenuissimus]
MWNGEEIFFQSLRDSSFMREGDIFAWIQISQRLRTIAMASGKLWSVIRLECDVGCNPSKRRSPNARKIQRALRNILLRAKSAPLIIEVVLRDMWWTATATSHNDLILTLAQAPNSWKSLTANVLCETTFAAGALKPIRTKLAGLHELSLWIQGWDNTLEDFVSGLRPFQQLRYLNLYMGTITFTNGHFADDNDAIIDWDDAGSVWPLDALYGFNERALFQPLVPVAPHWPSPFHQLTRLDITASDGSLLSVLGSLVSLQELHVLLVASPDCEEMFSEEVAYRLSKKTNGPQYTLRNLHSLSMRSAESRPSMANILCALACPRLQNFAIALPKWKGFVGHLSKFYTLVVLGSFLEDSGKNVDAFAVFPPPEHLLMPPYAACPTLQVALRAPTSRARVRAWLSAKMPNCKRSCWGEMRVDPNPYRDIWDRYTWPEAWKDFLAEWLPPWQLCTDTEILV